MGVDACGQVGNAPVKELHGVPILNVPNVWRMSLTVGRYIANIWWHFVQPKSKLYLYHGEKFSAAGDVAILLILIRDHYAIFSWCSLQMDVDPHCSDLLWKMPVCVMLGASLTAHWRCPIYLTSFTIYMAAIKENKSTIKQSSKQHTSIGQIYQMLLTALSHLKNACTILSDWEQIIKLSAKIWHITQCVSVRQGRQISSLAMLWKTLQRRLSEFTNRSKNFFFSYYIFSR